MEWNEPGLRLWKFIAPSGFSSLLGWLSVTTKINHMWSMSISLMCDEIFQPQNNQLVWSVYAFVLFCFHLISVNMCGLFWHQGEDANILQLSIMYKYNTVYLLKLKINESVYLFEMRMMIQQHKIVSNAHLDSFLVYTNMSCIRFSCNIQFSNRKS